MLCREGPDTTLKLWGLKSRLISLTPTNQPDCSNNPRRLVVIVGCLCCLMWTADWSKNNSVVVFRMQKSYIQHLWLTGKLIKETPFNFKFYINKSQTLFRYNLFLLQSVLDSFPLQYQDNTTILYNHVQSVYLLSGWPSIMDSSYTPTNAHSSFIIENNNH